MDNDQKSLTKKEEDRLLVIEKNKIFLKKVINKIGWPTIDKIGEEASKAAWLIAQHSDHDIIFQKKCLKLMKESIKNTNPVLIAYLEDRILVKESGKQKYGTQFYLEKGKWRPYPIRFIKTLDKRRESLGMSTFNEYLKIMNKKHK